MLLSAKELYKTYSLARAGIRVLQGASLDVAQGETVAIVGRSGAGKSTLLHTLGGLDRPQSGTVEIDGVPLYSGRQKTRNAIRSRKIGFVFQSYHLLPEMTIAENVLLPALAGPHPPWRALRERALALLAQVGLAERAGHKPPELSGGEQQRAALARALVNDPELILADEPTGNLDAVTGRQVIELLFNLSRMRGLSLVMVTHAPDLARLCSRVLELRDGRLFDYGRG